MARAGPEKAVQPCKDRVRPSYGDFLNSFAMKARSRCELKQLCCYINPDFSVKMSDVSEHSEFCFPQKKREKRGGHMITCLLTELGRAGRENIWPLVMAHGPRCARSVRHDLGPNILPSGPPTQSISTYYSPKWRWLAVDIYQAANRRGKHPTLATDIY